MDIRHLRHFLIILEEQSFSRASERLNVGQPALGAQMVALEHAVKQQLLVRHSRGITATFAGQVFAGHAKSILRAVDDSYQAMNELNDVRGKVAIGFLPSAGTLFTAPLVTTMLAEFPSVRLTIEEGMTAKLAKELTSGVLDLICIYDHGDERNAGFILEPLLEDHYCFLTHDPSFSKIGSVTFKRALTTKLILPFGATYLRRRLDSIASQLGETLDNVLEVHSEAQVKKLVSKGLGSSILPSISIRGEAADKRIFAARLTDPPMQATLSLARRATHPLSRSAEAVRDCVKRLSIDDDVANVEPMRPSNGRRPAAERTTPSPLTRRDASHP